MSETARDRMTVPPFPVSARCHVCRCLTQLVSADGEHPLCSRHGGAATWVISPGIEENKTDE